MPTAGTVFISVKDADKIAFVEICNNLISSGFKILATVGTTKYLNNAGIAAKRVIKVLEGRPHAVDAMLSGQLDLIFNTANVVS